MSKEKPFQIRREEITDPTYQELIKVNSSLTEEKIVMQEVLCDWRLFGLLPVLDCNNNIGYQVAFSNLKKNNSTLKKLLKDEYYGVATRMLISKWPEDSFERKYIEYLLIRCEAEVKVPLKSQVH
ncbi:hypothetical protein [Vibrio comitans]|uniref:Uncharacterized protein n=1 Tax=Vibrio comitans NBRC 102076 TaxID=1219078 RepID=A0A4Y3ISC8_9VIBR|nr:hypothetical protein [Vibrio comitans]GEA61945.1 hypothetical protein VCO01S_31380 [Vibrio comitans NBRC 102076]